MRGVIDDSKLQNIADTIREKTGTDKTYEPEAMPEGVAEVYEAGKQNGADEISLAHWKAITCNGTRTDWDGYSGYSPFMVTDYSGVKFPKPIVITGVARRLFRLYQGVELPRKEDIDMTGVTDVNAAFSYIYGIGCRIIPDYKIPALNSYTQTYDNAQTIHTIEIIRCNENTTFGSTFLNCWNLKNITFEGTIGRNISFSGSPLSVDTTKHIITHLKDYSGDKTNEFKYTLTLKADCWTTLEAEGETAPDGTTWLAYVESKGWNRA